MTHFMGFSMSAPGRVVRQAKSILTGKEHKNVRVTLTRPMRRDIRPLPVGEPINWRQVQSLSDSRRVRLYFPFRATLRF